MNPDQPWLTPETEWRGLVNRVRAGQPLRPPLWPDGARCAVALSFDCDHETFELGQGRAAIGRLAWGEYGRRRGVPRVLEVLGRHGVRASFFTPAVAGLIDPAALAGKPVLLTATGGGDKHALIIEHQLRPLFGFFEAATLPTGIYAGAADFTDTQPSSAPLLARLDRAVAQFSPWLDRATLAA